MIFNNPDVIKNSDDLRIGLVETDQPLSYLNYMNKVRNRILLLVVQYVKYQMSGGADHYSAIVAAKDLVCSNLYVPEKTDILKMEEGIVDDVLNSREYMNWETEMYYRFQNIHAGVVGMETPIPITSDKAIEMPELEGIIWDLLDGLNSTNIKD
jgi:hypothetical protein